MINIYKLARLETGRKQQEVSRETGIDATKLCKIENGWRVPCADEIRRLQKALPKLKELMEQK